MKQKCDNDFVEEAKLANIVDMALDFSSMIRLFKAGSKEVIIDQIIDVSSKRLFNVKSKDQFITVHSDFCGWGSNNILLAQRKKSGKIIKKSTAASYGQIAKTFDVALKVTIYYCHLPNYEKSKQICNWLNAAVDTKMMKMLSKKYPSAIKKWPTKIEEVNKNSYLVIQNLVRQFINDFHQNRILPVQFDDIYWRQLNR